MRYAILADIHSNLAAFETVLEDIARKGGANEIWCLGDIIGYGPQPHQCLELLRHYPHLCVAGNHDWAAIGKIDTSDFNPEAAAACHWTSKQLTPEDVGYLEGLPLTICRDNFTLVHGSPRAPIWEYLLSSEEALASFGCLSTRFCLVGHSHIPLAFTYNGEGVPVMHGLAPETNLSTDSYSLIINPGGVGQPRDGDCRASYAVYDSEAQVFYHYRIPYNIAATQQMMMEQGLPTSLITRLSYGL